MRCFQYVGLKDGAAGWLEEHVAVKDIVTHRCSKCGHEDTTKVQVELSSEHVDMFAGDGPDLITYRLKNGGTVKEVVQADPWSSGPMAFLCLELDDGTRLFEWTDEEIQENM